MQFFNDLFDKDNFLKRLNNIGNNFREEYKLNKINQLCLLVSDVEVTATTLENEYNIGPFLIIFTCPVKWQEQCNTNHENIYSFKFSGTKIGLAYYKGIEIELVEAAYDTNFFQFSPKSRNRDIELHHIGFYVSNVEKWSQKLKDNGSNILMRGSLSIGLSKIELAAFDIQEENIIIELISNKTFFLNLKPPSMVIHMLGRIEKLTGKRCIRY